jgi:hypothetical protein
MSKCNHFVGIWQISYVPELVHLLTQAYIKEDIKSIINNEYQDGVTWFEYCPLCGDAIDTQSYKAWLKGEKL